MRHGPIGFHARRVRSGLSLEDGMERRAQPHHCLMQRQRALGGVSRRNSRSPCARPFAHFLVVELDNGVSLNVQIMALIAEIEDAP